MTFKATSQPIDVAEVRQLAKLEGDMLARKEKRDRELEAILRGQDDRILLVIGPCSSDNEEAVLEYAKRLSALQEEVKDRISWSCVFILPSLGRTEMATKGLFISLMRPPLQV